MQAPARARHVRPIDNISLGLNTLARVRADVERRYDMRWRLVTDRRIDRSLFATSTRTVLVSLLCATIHDSTHST